MSKKTLIIIVAAFVAIVAGMFAFSFFFSRDAGEAGDRPGVFDFFPFGKSDDVGEERPLLPTQPAENGDLPQPSDSGAPSAQLLRQLTTTPIAGAISIQNELGTFVRYVERSTGNIYEINPKNFEKKRLSNTTIPAVREARFNATGNELHIRYLDENDVIKTFAARILAPGETINETEEEVVNETTEKPAPATQGSGRIVGSFIEDDIAFEAVSPDGNSVFYLMPFGTSMIGTTADFDDLNKEQVFISPFTEWLPQWPEANTIALSTKPSALADGFLYLLDIDSGVLEKVVGNVVGLTALVNPSVSHVLFSESADRGFTLHTIAIKERGSQELSLKTLPADKCVWSRVQTTISYCGVPSSIPQAEYPDAWYQGRVSFSDILWKIDVETQSTVLLSVPPAEAREEIDVINPFLSADEKYLFFTNKKDSTLWSLSLNP